MKGCVLSGLVLLLLATNGYALWQIVHLRAEVAELRTTVAALDGREAEPKQSLVETALRAVQRGQWEQARAALDRFADQMDPKTLAEKPRRQLERRLTEARGAVARKQRDAERALQALRRELPLPKRGPAEPRDDARAPGNPSWGGRV